MHFTAFSVSRMDSTNNVGAFSAPGRNTVLVDGHPSLPGDPRNVLENVLIGRQGRLPALHCNLAAVELAV